jgi:AcrR family transcriptional regulator
MELYGERGFDHTTVAEIAERAGLTERTFFRHFTDKREVLFSGADVLQERLVSGVIAAPDSAAPIEAVACGLATIGELLAERPREFPRQRQRIVAAHTELQERELMKLASLGSAMARALRERGVSEPAASLAAETGVAVFRVAFERWIDEAGEQDLPELIRDSLDELRALATGR